MIFSKYLYKGSGIRHLSVKKMRLKLGIGQLGFFVICVNPGEDQLDIYPSFVLKSRYIRKQPLVIAAIVNDEKEAEKYIIDMTFEAHRATGVYSIKSYIFEREPHLKEYLGC